MDPTEYRRELDQLNDEKERLEADLSRQIPEVSYEQGLKSVSAQSIAEALPVGAVLIDFIRTRTFNFRAVPSRGDSEWGPARYVALVLPALQADAGRVIDLGNADRIDRLVAKFRRWIIRRREDPKTRSILRTASNIARRESRQPSAPRGLLPHISEWLNPGKALRIAVFDPLIIAIGKRTRLFLAPDGDLTRLPFEVLPAADNRLLIDTYEISYLSVGRDVLRSRTGASGVGEACVVAADPDFDLGSEDSRSVPIFERLEDTKMEGEEVARILGVRPLLGAEVLERRLEACRSPSILHIATHAFFLPDQMETVHRRDSRFENSLRKFLPYFQGLLSAFLKANVMPERLFGQRLENPLLRSGLVLAGANSYFRKRTLPDQAGDGLLTAEEVATLDLRNTEMVVLSACHTGLGDVRVGEGVFGLRRAFALAGTKTLIMSLWAVPDQQTRDLIVEFYTLVMKGETRGAALRAAQLKLRKKYPDPWFWGAFICEGDAGPLPHSRD